jgi:hypothetical protein
MGTFLPKLDYPQTVQRANADGGVYVEVFVYLQLLDLLTTMIGLKLGLAEASPFIRALMTIGPEFGLLLSKLVGLGLGAICIALKRPRVIRLINYWYAALVVWNLALLLKVMG